MLCDCSDYKRVIQFQSGLKIRLLAGSLNKAEQSEEAESYSDVGCVPIRRMHTYYTCLEVRNLRSSLHCAKYCPNSLEVEVNSKWELFF